MNTAEWLEQFTGVKADGSVTGDGLAGLAQALEAEAALKEAMLADAYRAVSVIKPQFQKAMAKEVKVIGEWRKQRLLAVEGTQIDEAEFDDLKTGGIAWSPETQQIIKAGQNTIIEQSEKLKAAMTVRDGKTVPLFSRPELEDGYWFPLTRERVLPETYVASMYSKTQRMIDETNALYNNAVAVKAERGQLTPKGSRLKVALKSGAQLMTLGADLAGEFGAGSENAKLAGNLLTMMSGLADGAADAFDQLKAREYADGATTVLATLKILSCTVMRMAGVDENAVKAAEKGFSAGGAAITAGKHFARGADGAIDGTSILAGVLQSSLEIAAGQTSGEKAQALKIVAAVAPNTMRAAAKGGKLVQALEKGDVAGVVDALNGMGKDALNSVQEVRKAAPNVSKGDADKLDKETKALAGFMDLGASALTGGAVAMLSLSRGRYQQTFDTLLDLVAQNLAKTLTAVGLPEKQANMIGELYLVGSSSVKALECMVAEKPDVEGALREFSKGIGAAFSAAAPGHDALGKVGQTLSASVQGLADAAKVRKLYAEGKYDEAMEAFTKGFDSGLGKAFKISGKVQAKDEGDEEEDEGGDEDQGEPHSELEQALIGLGSSLEEAKGLIENNAETALDKAEKKIADEQANEEALAILAEAKADVSAPEQFGRDAADIERLIAKMQRDKMIMKMALQIAQGGVAFAASFVPGLAAVSAGIKMAAEFAAAAQRAVQLAQWVQSRDDLTAAQSALSSSAQNFVINQAEQFTHHTIQAAFAAAEMIGSIVRTVGAATYGAAEAVGAAVQAAGKVGQKLEQILRDYERFEELEAAWKLTARSLANPSNRKLALRARQLNPSLAKYSIAWGAVELKDPLARNAMRACGLTEAVLENRNANVDKVVEYLETFYDEDDKLYRQVEDVGKWVPTDVSLTLRYWVRLKTAAVKEVKLANPETGVIDGLLSQLSADPASLDEAGLRMRTLALEDLRRQWGAWTPQIKDAKGLQAMTAVLAILGKQVLGALGQVEQRQEQLERERAEQSEQARQARAAAMGKREFVVGECRQAGADLEAWDESDAAEAMRQAIAKVERLLEEIATAKPAEHGAKPIAEDQVVMSHVKLLRQRIGRVQELAEQAEEVAA